MPVAAVMIRAELSTADLVRAAKLAYLNAAISATKSGGGRANISRLAVVTGMTRKEVASLLKDDPRSADTAGDRGKQMEHRALRVLQGWTTDPLYRTAMGRPLDLAIKGDERNFASLVRAYGGDVTTVAVLRELERLNAIHRTRAGKLRPRARQVRPGASARGRFKDFSRLLADFSSTVSQLLSDKEPSLYFGFKEVPIAEESQAARFKASFSRRAAMLLEGVENWEEKPVKRNGSSRYPPSSSQRVGVGVYLVERQDRRTTKAGRKV